MQFHRYILIILLVSFVSLFSCKSDDTEEIVDDPKAENLKNLGASAEDILSNDIYESMTVEFVYTSAYPPMQETLDGFRDLLEQRLNKPDGITYIENVITIPLESSYSLEEIREIENEHRNIYTTDDNIALYIFFSNAKAQGDTQTTVTLGTAYLNTSLVVYEKTLQDISNSQNIDLEILEAATLHHEFGHILALVNLTDDDIHQQHEDMAHNNHCMIENCLMYYASNITRSLKRLNAIPVFDALCIEDLQAKGGK